MTFPRGSPAPQSARDRILDSAYELFTRRAVRNVGVDELVTAAGVATATFYRNFSSKDELVVAILARREQAWTLGTVESEARRRGETPRERLLAIFDVFDEWFRREGFEACTFINILVEMGPEHPLGQTSIEHLANIRTVIRALAEEAGLRDVDEFARSWHILMKGSIISATEGDHGAAMRAKRMAEWLLQQHEAA
jgi:AcrR family transcriptional regulator